MKFLFYTYQAIFQLFKSKFGILLQVIAAFILPIKALMILIGIMILFDTMTGLWKARKNSEIITSRKLSKVISKMVLYQVAIITFYALDKFIFGELISVFTSIPFLLTKIVGVFFVGIELLSINENIEAVTGTNFFRTFRKMLSRAKDVKKDIDDIVDGSDSNDVPMD